MRLLAGARRQKVGGALLGREAGEAGEAGVRLRVGAAARAPRHRQGSCPAPGTETETETWAEPGEARRGDGGAYPHPRLHLPVSARIGPRAGTGSLLRPATVTPGT